jgi:hypothetical protein
METHGLGSVIPVESPSDFVQLLVNAALSGRWPLVAALVLVGLVWVGRKLLAPKVPFFATGAGGAVLNLLTSFSVALATALLPGTAFTWSLLWVALQASLVAAGGWSLLKYLLPLVPGLGSLFARGDAAASIASSEKVGLATEPPARKAEDVVNGP